MGYIRTCIWHIKLNTCVGGIYTLVNQVRACTCQAGHQSRAAYKGILFRDAVTSWAELLGNRGHTKPNALNPGYAVRSQGGGEEAAIGGEGGGQSLCIEEGDSGHEAAVRILRQAHGSCQAKVRGRGGLIGFWRSTI